MNPRGQPQHRSTSRGSDLLGSGQQLRADLGAGERLLHVEAQQFRLGAGRGQLVAGCKRDLCEAYEMTLDFGDENAVVLRSYGLAECGLRVRGQNLTCEFRAYAISGIGVQEYLHGQDGQAKRVLGRCNSEREVGYWLFGCGYRNGACLCCLT